MTILICSGPLFSDWENIPEKYLLPGSSHHKINVELSALNTKICLEHMPGTENLNFRSFSPDQSYSQKAKQLLSFVQTEPQPVWADVNSCLILDFWQEVSEDTRFVLFFSSPEYELSNYLKNNLFDSSTVKSVIDAWKVRTRAMLTFFMNTRNKCLLVNVQSATRNPGNLIRKINETFDTCLTSAEKNSTHTPEESVMYKYLAATLLANNGAADELFNEACSTATQLDDDFGLPDIQVRTALLVPNFLRQAGQQEKQKRALAQTADKLIMMELQLHQTQKELEFYYLKERDTATLNEQYLEFLNQNPLLKLARLARLNESPE